VNGEPLKQITFYFDTTHGKLIPRLLKGVGMDVRHYAHFGLSADADDEEWISHCAEHEWVIISGDKTIARDPHERQAVINGKCKVFMLDDSDVTPTEDWAAALVTARQKIVEIVLRTNGPYFVLIKPCRASGHVRAPQFVEAAGGGWKLVEEWPQKIARPTDPPERPIRKRQQRQRSLQFPEQASPKPAE
jgi:hypothetical protein